MRRSAAAGLPAETSALVGRDAELARIAELLAVDDVRLVTLTGPGGVGKSRLGLRAAAGSAEAFADGVAYVPLGALDDAALVPAAIAGALGDGGTGELPALDRVLAHLGDREMLVLLDCFEHVLSAAGLVADVLAACPGLKLLITSRAPLEIAGEHEFRVPPLEESSATSLFVQRACAVDQDFALTAGNAGAVAEICRRLDGLPLAIELAAARIRLLGPEAMVQRLDHRLELLTSGRRDAPRRQQTMREAIAWSYDLLAPPEQRLFRTLSVFAGGCTLPAIESVAQDQPNVLQLVEALLVQSMVVSVGGEGEPRVGTLETLQEYGSAMLEVAGERATTESAHIAWCVEFARQAGGALWGPDQLVWLDRIERELPNLRAAFRRLVDQGHPDQAGGLVADLERFWWARGHLVEGRAWLEGSLRSATVGPADRARCLSIASTLAFYEGEHAHGSALSAEAVDSARRSGDQEALARALSAAALAARGTGDVFGARENFEAAIAIFRTLDLRHRLADSCARFAASVLWQSGTEPIMSADEVAAVAEEALTLSRQADDAEGILYAGAVLAWSLLSIDEARSRAMLPELLEGSRASRVSRTTARVAFLKTMILLREGDHVRARAELLEAGAISSEFGDRSLNLWFVLPSLARTAYLAGRHDDAARLLAATDNALEETGSAMPLWIRADRGAGIDSMRASLTREGHDAARAEGAALTVEEAIERERHAVPDGSGDLGGTKELGTLTSREVEVLRLLTLEMTDAGIAQELVLSRRTVHAHLRSIYRKLEVGSRVAAARWAVEHELGD